MTTGDDEFDAQLAESGDDRAGVDEVDLYTDDDDLTDDADDLDSDSDDDSDEYDDDEDDDEDDEGEDDEDEGDDYPDDATEDDVDLIAALYHEDGVPRAVALQADMANDLDALIEELRRVPGDGGAVGIVSIASEFFVMVRVRGQKVQVLLSDIVAAGDWPIARDVVDYLGLDVPSDDDDSEAVGDIDLFTDVGLSEMELESMCDDLDSEPLDIIETVVEKLGFSGPYDRVAASFDL